MQELVLSLEVQALGRPEVALALGMPEHLVLVLGIPKHLILVIYASKYLALVLGFLTLILD